MFVQVTPVNYTVWAGVDWNALHTALVELPLEGERVSHSFSLSLSLSPSLPLSLSLGG